jgi:hypothetical protein
MRQAHTLTDDDWEAIVALVVRWRELAEGLAAVFVKHGDRESARSAAGMTEMADEILGRLGYGRDRLTVTDPSPASARPRAPEHGGGAARVGDE